MLKPNQSIIIFHVIAYTAALLIQSVLSAHIGAAQPKQKGGPIMNEVDGLIVGVPKAGTTWLANILSQNPDIILSDPKEPNIIASHQGTFGRDIKDPDWLKYNSCFNGKGSRIDASVHTFSCPLSPARIHSRIPNIKLILCLREPVSRAVSHWKMVIDTEADIRNGTDWSDFSTAWLDNRLSDDSLYGKSMQRWLEYFSLDQFLIIDSQRMRDEPEKVLIEINNFLMITPYQYETSTSKHANSASSRGPITIIGKSVRLFFSLVPKIIKNPIVKSLQRRDLNIYRIPLMSKRAKVVSVGPEHYSTCANRIHSDLEVFKSLTNFDTKSWLELFSFNQD
jgi:hypothetical protein